ncbi:hypothetical protein ACIBP6_35970 [Nonomuraea terrae]|uniref:hypothetical protein n=1 Tax=Nonomuraea terrae TaxID=2530383 RepID=UPI0037A6288F
MKKIVAVAGLVVLAAVGATAAAGDGSDQREVSQEQYDTLIAQCRYADTGPARCRAEVRRTYRVGNEDTELDCRAYAGVAVCGELKLSKTERRCVRESTEQGLSLRRAEVECYTRS